MNRKELSVWVEKYRTGNISRRNFLQVTGIGATIAALGLNNNSAIAQNLSGTVNLATWPNYHNQANLDAFTKLTGVPVNMSVFGSNEELLAKIQAGDSGADVIVPSGFTIKTYHELNIIEPLELSLVPNFQASAVEPRFIELATIDGKMYGLHKDWGTTGFVYNTKKVTTPINSAKAYFDECRGQYSGQGIALDNMLSTVGYALAYFGYSINSVKEDELKKAEELLIDLKPHLFGISSDFNAMILSGDATISMAWNWQARQIRKQMPEIQYALAPEGGEIWSDYYSVASASSNRAAAYALINYLLEPHVNLKEFDVHGSAISDTRVYALLPPEDKTDPILYPAKELLTPQEFGVAEAMSDPLRNEVMARFKAA